MHAPRTHHLLSGCTNSFAQAGAFNRNLCGWGTDLSANVDVFQMFSQSGCTYKTSPDLAGEEILYFCQDCTADPPTAAPISGGGNGDPHFKKWGGEWYDFHGICDMVLVHSEDFGDGLGLDIHIRTKPRYEFSYIEATAIKIGEDVLEVGSWGEYWINGVESAGLSTTMMANKYAVDHILDNKKKHRFVITLDEYMKESILINVHKDMVNVNVENATMANFGTSSGLLGSFPDGDKLARNGATIVEDNNLFGQEWQVRANATQLFLSTNQNQNIAGVCIPPVASKGRRLGERIAMEAAEKACAHHKEEQIKDMCIFDVIAMGDLEVADIHGAF